MPRSRAPTIENYLLKVPHPLREVGGLRRINDTSSIEFPLVTILTAVRNRKETLPRTIMSVANQTYENIEYIIVDGASTDGTLDVIRANDEYINFWISEPDENVPDAVNKAISLAKGEFIFWLSSDDWIDVDFIEKAVTVFKKNCAYDFIFGGVKLFTNNTHIDTIYSRPFSGSSFESKDGQGPLFPSMMLKRICFVNAGLLNCHYTIATDLEFFERLVHRGYEGLFNADLIVNYSTGGLADSNYFQRTYEQLHIARQYGHLSIFIVSAKIYSVIYFIAGRVAVRIFPISVFHFIRKVIRRTFPPPR